MLPLPLSLLLLLVRSAIVAAEVDCMSQSMVTKSLAVTSAHVEFASSVASGDHAVSFEIRNAAAARSTDTTLCAATTNDPHKWYPCSVGNSTATAVTEAFFQYDPAANWLTVNETWVCSDEAADHVVQFGALGGDAVPMECNGGGQSTHKCSQQGDLELQIELSMIELRPYH